MMPVQGVCGGGGAGVTDMTDPGSRKGVGMPGRRPDSPSTVYSVMSVTSHEILVGPDTCVHPFSWTAKQGGLSLGRIG